MKNYFYEISTDQQKGVLAFTVKIVFYFVSLIYRLMVGFRRLFYRIGILKSHRLPKKVISIGNLTWGGTGKTPLVQYIVEVLKKENIRPVILTRGYMSEKNSESDEAQLLKASCGVEVLVGRNRFANAQSFLKNRGEVDVFILDDGFQHWQLQRDLDIVVIDVTNPFGNGQLIPRGILREDLNALQRADMILLTRTDLNKNNLVVIKNRLKLLNLKFSVVESIHEPKELIDLKTKKSLDISKLLNKTICAFSSIGNPQAFEETLKGLGATIDRQFIFEDHYSYKQSDIDEMVKYCRIRGISTLVTTQKDEVKLASLLSVIGDDISVVSLKIAITISSGKDALFERIRRCISH